MVDSDSWRNLLFPMIEAWFLDSETESDEPDNNSKGTTPGGGNLTTTGHQARPQHRTCKQTTAQAPNQTTVLHTKPDHSTDHRAGQRHREKKTGNNTGTTPDPTNGTNKATADAKKPDHTTRTQTATAQGLRPTTPQEHTRQQHRGNRRERHPRTGNGKLLKVRVGQHLQVSQPRAKGNGFGMNFGLKVDLPQLVYIG